MELSYYIMELITHVDMSTIQYVPQTKQILISRVDCINEGISDEFIVNHILAPCINEFLYIFYLIESRAPQATSEKEEPAKTNKKQYLN